jgi:hypothetical protein
VASSLQASQPKCCMHLSPPPCAPHASPISSSLLFPCLRSFQSIRPIPRPFVTFRNVFLFLRWGVVSPPPNPQAGGPSLVGCPRLLIQYIRSYPPHLQTINPIIKFWVPCKRVLISLNSMRMQLILVWIFYTYYSIWTKFRGVYCQYFVSKTNCQRNTNNESIKFSRFKSLVAK